MRGLVKRIQRYDQFMIPALLFAYVFWFRVHGLEQRFGLYGDQIRDWEIAQRRLIELPLTGVPSTAGGFTVGPAYYWVLWLVAHSIGPSFDRLPHGGGYGLALLHSAADVLLWYALASHWRSAVALAAVLLCATAGLDATMAGTIWNPPVAETFVKTSIALTLLRRGTSLFWTAAIAATAWLAVHAHTSGAIVAIVLLPYSVLHAARRHGAVRGLQDALVIALVVGCLQIPWLVASPAPDTKSSIATSVEAVIDAPVERLRVVNSAKQLVRAVGVFLFSSTVPIGLIAALLAAGVFLLVVTGASARMLTCGPGVLLAALMVFSIWQGPQSQVYWFMPMLPSAAICLTGWVSGLPDRSRLIGAISLVALIAAAQPGRARAAWSLHSSPYGHMVAGARAIIALGHPVSTIRVASAPEFEAQAEYVYSILGGRIDQNGPVAIIDASGRAVLQK